MSNSGEEIDQEALAEFVSKKGIKQRTCSVYVRNLKSKANNCMCGRSKEWHEEKGIDVHKHNDSNTSWDYKSHTKTCPADSFGIIEFQDFEQETLRSPYIRLSPKTDLETLWTLMTHHWKIPIPKLLISVTGGAQGFDLAPRLQAVFKRGLINAATSTGAWIITGGIAAGVTRIIGDAVRNHRITSSYTTNEIIALGIATWDCISNRYALEGDGDRELFPATYSSEYLPFMEVSDEDPLDHYHTHFILLDNGSDGKFGAEIEFRSAFEQFVSNKEIDCVDESERVKVPVVLLVIEGDINTITTVYESILKNIPVLVFKGSGKAADFIAYGYDLTKDPNNEDQSQYPEDFVEKMMSTGEEKFAWIESDISKETILKKCINPLMNTLKHRELVNIFNLDEAETKDIESAILYALLKANKTNANAQLSLALAWNRCDIARHEIFTKENRHNWKKIPLYNAMVSALVQDRVDFVQLYLENGVSLKKFLSIDTLWKLYGLVLKDSSDALAQMVNNLIRHLRQTWTASCLCHDHNVESTAKDPELLYKIGKLMVHLLGDENFNLYKDEKFRRKHCTNHNHTKQDNSQSTPQSAEATADSNTSSTTVSTSEPTGAQGVSAVDTGGSTSAPGGSTTDPGGTKSARHSSDSLKPKTKQEYDFGDNAQRELFLWAILFNRRDLAEMLWRVGQDQLGAALTACALLKRLSSVANDEEELELSQDLLDHANMYEDRAVGVLSECYKKDKMMAHLCLVRRLELYGRTTLFTLADTHTLMKFMGHTCCQTKLNLIWKGSMALYTPTLKIILCVFFPFMVRTITFTTHDDDDSENEEVQNKVGDALPRDKSTQGENIPSNNDKPNEESQNKVSTNDPFDGGDVSARPNTGRKNKKKVFRVQMCGDARTNTISLLNAFYRFYRAPVSVFVVNTISYLIFLGLFTYFVLTDLYPDHLSVVECIVWGWTITMLTEEIRQVISNDKRSLYDKVNGWFGSMWNRFDLAMYTIFSVSVILRFTLTDTNFTYCRTCYSITVAMYYLRFMQVFFAEKNSGPKVIMITNMVIDLVFFLGIFLFFLLSFGIMYQANLFPNSPPSWYLLKSILYMPYWQMYGELFLDKLEGESQDTCTNNESIWRPAGGRDRCPENNALVPLLGAVYLILTNILLVNLLIAMFSYSFQMVQDRSELVWRFYRYSLVHEFYYRPKLCPPFIILSHIIRSIIYVKRHTCSRKEYTDDFRLNLNENDNNRLTLFVRSAAEMYLSLSQKAQKEELGTKVADTSIRIDRVIEELYSIKEHVKFTRSPKVDENRPGFAEPSINYTLDNMSRTQLTIGIETRMEGYGKKGRELSRSAPMNNISDTESDDQALNDTDTNADIDTNRANPIYTFSVETDINYEKREFSRPVHMSNISDTESDDQVLNDTDTDNISHTPLKPGSSNIITTIAEEEESTDL